MNEYDFLSKEDFNKLNLSAIILGGSDLEKEMSARENIVFEFDGSKNKSIIINEKFFGELLADRIESVIPKDSILVIIQREGDLFFAGFKNRFKDSTVYKVGVLRFAGGEKDLYFYNYKDIKEFENKKVTLIDSIAHTGGTLDFIIKQLNLKSAKELNALILLSGLEFIKDFNKEYPNVNLFIGAIDQRLLKKNVYLENKNNHEERAEKIAEIEKDGYLFKFNLEDNNGGEVLFFEKII